MCGTGPSCSVIAATASTPVPPRMRMSAVTRSGRWARALFTASAGVLTVSQILKRALDLKGDEHLVFDDEVVPAVAENRHGDPRGSHWVEGATICPFSCHK